MAAEISGRTGGSGTASMPPAAASKPFSRTECDPARPDAGTGQPTGHRACPAGGSAQPAVEPAQSGAGTGQPTGHRAHPAVEPAHPGRPPLQSGEELEAVKRYVLLGIAVRILDHDIRVVGSSRLKLPRFYESILRGLQDRVLLELAALRRMFRTSGIKVYEERMESEGLTAAYVCRGYHHHFTMPWSFVRAEAERLLKRYSSPD